jgi:hypothetical protein
MILDQNAVASERRLMDTVWAAMKQSNFEAMHLDDL